MAPSLLPAAEFKTVLSVQIPAYSGDIVNRPPTIEDAQFMLTVIDSSVIDWHRVARKTGDYNSADAKRHFEALKHGLASKQMDLKLSCSTDEELNKMLSGHESSAQVIRDEMDVRIEAKRLEKQLKAKEVRLRREDERLKRKKERLSSEMKKIRVQQTEVWNMAKKKIADRKRAREEDADDCVLEPQKQKLIGDITLDEIMRKVKANKGI